MRKIMLTLMAVGGLLCGQIAFAACGGSHAADAVGAADSAASSSMMDKASQAVGDAADSVGDAAKKVGDSAGNMMDKAGDGMDKMMGGDHASDAAGHSNGCGECGSNY